MKKFINWVLKPFSAKRALACLPKVDKQGECFYRESIENADKSLSALQEIAQETTLLASQVANKLRERNYLLPRERRLEDLNVCRDEILQIYKALNDAVDIICMTDIRGKVLFANDRFLETYGFSSKELLGSPISVISAKQTPKEVYLEMWQTILQSRIWTGRMRNRNRFSGNIIEVESSIIPVHNRGTSGRPDYFICIQTVVPEGE